MGKDFPLQQLLKSTSYTKKDDILIEAQQSEESELAMWRTFVPSWFRYEERPTWWL